MMALLLAKNVAIPNNHDYKDWLCTMAALFRDGALSSLFDYDQSNASGAWTGVGDIHNCDSFRLTAKTANAWGDGDKFCVIFAFNGGGASALLGYDVDSPTGYTAPTGLSVLFVPKISTFNGSTHVYDEPQTGLVSMHIGNVNTARNRTMQVWSDGTMLFFLCSNNIGTYDDDVGSVACSFAGYYGKVDPIDDYDYPCCAMGAYYRTYNTSNSSESWSSGTVTRCTCISPLETAMNKCIFHSGNTPFSYGSKQRGAKNNSLVGLPVACYDYTIGRLVGTLRNVKASDNGYEATGALTEVGDGAYVYICGWFMPWNI
jgi:hypothetical protein